MERGEANINAEFIFMLCSLVGIKASDFFSLLEDIILELDNVTMDKRGNEIKIKIVSSNELNELNLKYKEYYELPTEKTTDNGLKIYSMKDLLKHTGGRLRLETDEIENYLSDDIISRVKFLSKIRLSKEEIKELVQIKSKEIEENLNEIAILYSGGGGLAAGGMSGSVLIGTAIAGPLGFLVGSLFNSYKKSKEK